MLGGSLRTALVKLAQPFLALGDKRRCAREEPCALDHLLQAAARCAYSPGASAPKPAPQPPSRSLNDEVEGQLLTRCVPNRIGIQPKHPDPVVGANGFPHDPEDLVYKKDAECPLEPSEINRSVTGQEIQGGDEARLIQPSVDAPRPDVEAQVLWDTPAPSDPADAEKHAREKTAE